MGAPTETWRTYKIKCSKCSEERFVEMHHDWEPLDDEDKVYPPYGLKMKRQGWEFRIEEQDAITYVDFVCSKCVAEEGKGKVMVKA